MDYIKILSTELNIKPAQVQSAVELLDAGNTVPFISRYRKEVTGSLDDTQLRALSTRLDYLRSLQKRREEITSSITEQGKLTDELSAAIEKASTLAELEDIYRPYKQGRKTRASVAREKGLEGLAALIMLQNSDKSAVLAAAQEYISEEKGVASAEDAISGACDIIAEDISDNAAFRARIRALTWDRGILSSKKTSDAQSVYEMYYDYSEPLKKIPGHRILAINRAEKENFVRVSVDIDEGEALNIILSQVVKGNGGASQYVRAAAEDSYKRLIAPSIEREIRSDMFDKASEGAIKVFSENLKNLLLSPPLKGKTVLGFDPGYRTGCKLAVVDKTGRVLDTAVVYPTKPQERIEESETIMGRLIDKYGVDIVAVGNGTASKESEIFVAGLIKKKYNTLKYAMVSESGASVYSASALGAEEFPDFDVTQRSAVSIARRLQDPLAELVKIDPKSIGVGQYQHDMKPAVLDGALEAVVEDSVNAVGVDLNTASWSLLGYVAGINKTSAKNIVKYREENGEFASRSQVKKVPRIGDKAFEQCAGFLRIPGGKDILDNTGVHPESYTAAKELLKRYGYTLSDVKEGKLEGLSLRVDTEGRVAVAELLGIGVPTLTDILRELEKPGRDLRDALPPPILRADVMDMNDLSPGMRLTGTVRNVVDFGAFVDIGVHQDGLVHVSQISDRFIKHPSEALSVGDIVEVAVISADTKTKRISLTMKGLK
ncbi:MAG: Tex family protein [Eubacteriales bacterium]